MGRGGGVDGLLGRGVGGRAERGDCEKRRSAVSKRRAVKENRGGDERRRSR